MPSLPDALMWPFMASRCGVPSCELVASCSSIHVDLMRCPIRVLLIGMCHLLHCARQCGPLHRAGTDPWTISGRSGHHGCEISGHCHYSPNSAVPFPLLALNKYIELSACDTCAIHAGLEDAHHIMIKTILIPMSCFHSSWGLCQRSFFTSSLTKALNPESESEAVQRSFSWCKYTRLSSRSIPALL